MSGRESAGRAGGEQMHGLAWVSFWKGWAGGVFLEEVGAGGGLG